MDIMTALDMLSGYLDGYCGYGELSDEEFDELNEVEDVIRTYIMEKEKENK